MESVTSTLPYRVIRFDLEKKKRIGDTNTK